MDEYLCKLTDSGHLFKDPRVLPCNSVACHKCIQKSIDHFSCLDCKLCGNVHKIVGDLLKSPQTIESMRFNSKKILTDLSIKIKKYNNNIKGIFYYFSFLD